MRARSATARALLAAALLAALACGESEPTPEAPSDAAPAPARAQPRPRALWVLCEGSQRVLEHPERIEALISDSLQLGATDLFVQVYRGGRAWFDSTQADPAPHRAIVAAHGRDTLRELIERAHGAGLRVHAWVNVFSLSSNRDAPLLRDLGRGAVLADQHGRSILDYPDLEVPPPDRSYYRMGTRAVWLDPGAPGVAARLVATFSELMSRYPELDGLHLDYVRYPGVLPFAPGSRFGVGLDFGHGAATRARFLAETGVEAPSPGNLGNSRRWDDWRRDQVTGLVRATRDALNSIDATLQLSAAVWSHVDRAYLSIGQDWWRWLEEDLLNFAVPMVYTLDDRIFRYQVEAFAGAPLAARVWIGAGTWLFAKHPERALAQLRIAREAGSAGDSLFSWDAIADAPALRDALAQEARGDDS